jgi:hypothetical protein
MREFADVERTNEMEPLRDDADATHGGTAVPMRD